MNFGEIIGRGRTADVYHWKEGRILKLYREWFPAANIEQEARISEIVSTSGLPVPRIDGLVEINGRTGIVFERIEGTSLLTQMEHKPWKLYSFTRFLAELHATIHRCQLPALPSQLERMHRLISRSKALPGAIREQALHALTRLPEGSAVCHGDFHPDNILVTSERALVIDWMTATRGNPLGDVARTSLILSMDCAPPDRRLPFILRKLRGLGHDLYLRRYFKIMPGSEGDLNPWMLPLAAIRFDESPDDEKEQVLEFIRGLSG